MKTKKFTLIELFVVDGVTSIVYQTFYNMADITTINTNKPSGSIQGAL